MVDEQRAVLLLRRVTADDLVLDDIGDLDTFVAAMATWVQGQPAG